MTTTAEGCQWTSGMRKSESAEVMMTSERLEKIKTDCAERVERSNLPDSELKRCQLDNRPAGSVRELATGFLRYEALRKLRPREFEELHRRNLKGEFFDEMVNELILQNL